jgi:hypothetical protein
MKEGFYTSGIHLGGRLGQVSFLHFSPERGCVEDQPQPSRTVQALRLVEDDTAALRHSAMVLSLR